MWHPQHPFSRDLLCCCSSVLSLITDNNELPSFVVAKWRRLLDSDLQLLPASIRLLLNSSPPDPRIGALLSLAQCCKIYRVTYETNSWTDCCWLLAAGPDQAKSATLVSVLVVWFYRFDLRLIKMLATSKLLIPHTNSLAAPPLALSFYLCVALLTFSAFWGKFSAIFLPFSCLISHAPFPPVSTSRSAAVCRTVCCMNVSMYILWPFSEPENVWIFRSPFSRTQIAPYKY